MPAILDCEGLSNRRLSTYLSIPCETLLTESRVAPMGCTRPSRARRRCHSEATPNSAWEEHVAQALDAACSLRTQRRTRTICSSSSATVDGTPPDTHESRDCPNGYHISCRCALEINSFRSKSPRGSKPRSFTILKQSKPSFDRSFVQTKSTKYAKQSPSCRMLSINSAVQRA